MYTRLKFWSKLALVLLFISFLFPMQNFTDFIKYSVFNKNNYILNLNPANSQVKILCADSSNQLMLQVYVTDLTGKPMSNIPVRLSVSNSLGQIYPSSLRTNKLGYAVAAYIPPSATSKQFPPNGTHVNITSDIQSTSIQSSFDLQLIRPPIILIHGYQEHVNIFDNMKDFLTTKGFDTLPFSYSSEKGVISAAYELETFLNAQKAAYLLKGIQVGRFDLITHSMGGLVARYYTSSNSYIKDNNVNKIIFISVPHRGSYWAALGVNYLNDQGIKDLAPDNVLLSKALPTMLNKGLNQRIQIGSILGQYDEVVTPESASLDEWNIKTEMFNVGENNFTMDNLLNGNILDAANHKNVLFNKKVFEKIEEMLVSDLPYPAVKNK